MVINPLGNSENLTDLVNLLPLLEGSDRDLKILTVQQFMRQRSQLDLDVPTWTKILVRTCCSVGAQVEILLRHLWCVFCWTPASQMLRACTKSSLAPDLTPG